MLFELAQLGLVGLLGFAFSLILYNAITITLTSIRFRKKLGTFKLAEGFSLFDGHIKKFIFRDYFMYHVDDLIKQYGKTFGWLYANKQGGLTVDLDLLKRIVCDEPQVNRIVINLPIKEAEIDSIMTARDDQWRRIRKNLAPALKSNKFKAPNVQREIERSIEKLVGTIESRFRDVDASDGSEIQVDLEDIIHRYSLDLVLSCFYKQDKLIDFHSKHDPMVETVDAGLREVMWNPMIRLSVAFPILRPLIDWLMWTFHPQGQWRKTLLEFIRQQTRLNLEARKQVQRLKSQGKQVDENNVLLEDGSKFSRNLIDDVIDRFHEGKLTQQEYFHSTWFLVNAADKTASDCLSHTIYQLAINEPVQTKLRQSIIRDGIESSYLTQVLNESLRLLPPAPIGCSRVTSKDFHVEGGGCMPADTFVISPVYTIHRLPEYWGPDADQFRPERFENTDHFHPLQFIPFGAGVRMCPGKEFALHEMKKLLCALLTNYEFHCEPQQIRYQAPFFVFVFPDKHFHVTIRRFKQQHLTL